LLVVVPATLVLLTLGDRIIRIWMGPEFSVAWLLPILALGHMTALSTQPAYFVLLGLAKHGIPAALNLATAIVSTIVTAVLLARTDLGLNAAALGIAVPLTLSNGVILPIYTSRVLNVRLRDLLAQACLRPLAVCVPVGLLLWAFEAWTEPGNIVLLGGELAVAGLVFLALSAVFVLDSVQRRRYLRRLRLVRAG
jgi:O-antigen/teichoic acid export membrane protein